MRKMNNWHFDGNYLTKIFYHNDQNGEFHERKFEVHNHHMKIPDGIYQVINCALRYDAAYECRLMSQSSHPFGETSTGHNLALPSEHAFQMNEGDRVVVKNERKRNFLDLSYVI